MSDTPKKKPTLFLGGLPIGEVDFLKVDQDAIVSNVTAGKPLFLTVTGVIAGTLERPKPTLRERVDAAFGNTDPRLPEFRGRA